VDPGLLSLDDLHRFTVSEASATGAAPTTCEGANEPLERLLKNAVRAGWMYFDPSVRRAVVHIPAHLKEQRRLAKVFIGQIPKEWSSDFLLQLIHQVAGIPVYRDLQICNAKNSRYGCTKLFVEDAQAHRLLALNQRIEVREDAYRVLERGESAKKGAGLLVVEMSTAQHSAASFGLACPGGYFIPHPLHRDVHALYNAPMAFGLPPPPPPPPAPPPLYGHAHGGHAGGGHAGGMGWTGMMFQRSPRNPQV
jgi:hypothetical protein